ncbi:MAG: hypothetical protein ACAI43_09500 [Phycisphaerae bacterium]
MGIIDELLTRPEFADRPPVLFDVGASGHVHAKWRPIARYCVCVAFDADRREMGYLSKTDGGFRTLHVCPAVVTDRPEATLPFYLTASPFCSSLLPPDPAAVSEWLFAPLFVVERTIELPATTLRKVMADLKLDRVDWVKCDSQGTDLRLFRSLGDELGRRALAAEFEPGFMDVYQGEDTLGDVLTHMRGRPFYLADLVVHTQVRVRRAYAEQLRGASRRFLHALVKAAPGWGEMTFLNTMRDADADGLGAREWLLAWVFAVVEEQLGFALDLATRAAARFPDPVFARLVAESSAMLRRTARRRLPGLVVRRAWAKATSVFRRG